MVACLLPQKGRYGFCSGLPVGVTFLGFAELDAGDKTLAVVVGDSPTAVLELVRLALFSGILLLITKGLRLSFCLSEDDMFYRIRAL